MPRSGGVFSLVASYFAVAGQSIRTEQHNPVLEDIASALTGSLPRDGSAAMLGNLAMSGFRVTGIADAVGPQDAVTLGQIPETYNITALRMTGPAILGRITASLGAVDALELGDGLVFDVSLVRADWASPAEAIAGASLVKVMSPVRTAQYVTGILATQALAEAGANNETLMTPLRTEQHMTANDLGRGQTISDVSASRLTDTIYQNTTSRPIEVHISLQSGGAALMQIRAAPADAWVTVARGVGVTAMTHHAVVPSGWYYRVTDNGATTIWAELR